MKELAWPLWIVGMVLVVLSWVHVVSHTVGWIGFGGAVAGWALWRVGGGSREEPDRGAD